MLRQLRLLLRLTRPHGIARRYIVTNGFDGALTMLGLLTGFYVSGEAPLSVAISACLGAAIALGVSGLTSGYISEAAERKRDLHELEDAMVADLGDTAHGRAARLIPFLLAAVNGASPFLISLVIVAPLWLASLGIALPWAPLEAAIGVAFVAIFLLGVFLGRISGVFWLWAGVRTVLIALATALLILLLEL